MIKLFKGCLGYFTDQEMAMPEDTAKLAEQQNPMTKNNAGSCTNVQMKENIILKGRIMTVQPIDVAHNRNVCHTEEYRQHYPKKSLRLLFLNG